MSAQLHIYPDANAAAEACAHRVTALLEDALSEKEFATFAMSGGSTPRLLFDKLALSKFRWDRVHLFWVDERCVPPADPASNYKLASDHWLQQAHIAPRLVHRIVGEMAPQAAAERYAGEIREFFGLDRGEMPRFDVVHRGMGPDAHTASLFPGDALIEDRERIAAAAFSANFNQWRVTLLPGVLLAAKHTVMLVAGADKVEALRAVLREPYEPTRYPAQLGAREAEWFVDQAAGPAE